MPAATLRVASIPFAAQRGAVDHNVARVVAHIDRAARAGVGLAVFPEASLTGGIDSRAASAGDARRTHRADLKALAVGIDSPCVRAVAAAVDRTGVAAGVGLIERAASGELYDSYAVCLPGGERHVHRMLQTDGQPHIARGDAFTVFDTPAGWRLAVLVGGDHYLVENARMASLLGAALLVAPQACPDAATMGSEADETNAWTRHALPARALDNGMFVVYSDGGYGAIVDPFGRIVARGEHGAADDGMIVADLDPALIGTSPGQRWLDARRPDLYARLARASHAGAATFEPRSANARGSIAMSFATVRRV